MVVMVRAAENELGPHAITVTGGKRRSVGTKLGRVLKAVTGGIVHRSQGWRITRSRLIDGSLLHHHGGLLNDQLGLLVKWRLPKNGGLLDDRWAVRGSKGRPTEIGLAEGKPAVIAGEEPTAIDCPTRMSIN